MLRLLALLLLLLPFGQPSPTSLDFSFSLDSESLKPNRFFAKAVICDFKRRQETFEGSPLEKHVKSLLDAVEGKPVSALIKNYNLIKDKLKVQKEVYYLAHVALIFAHHYDCANSIKDFVKNVIMDTECSELTDYLIQLLHEQLPSLLSNLLCVFIDEGLEPEYKLLLDRYPDLVNVRVDPNGLGQDLTPLAVAVKADILMAVIDLIRRGADVNAIVLDDTSYGRYPLLFCALHRESHSDDMAIIDRLFESSGFKRELCVDERGMTPVHYILNRGFTCENLGLLVSWFDWRKPLNAYVMTIVNHFNVEASIIEFQSDWQPQERDVNGTTYLIIAAAVNNAAVVERLLQHHSRSHFQLSPGYTDGKGRSALLEAILHRSHAALRVLVRYTSELEINDNIGPNPLAWAIFYQDAEAVRILLQHPNISVEVLINLPNSVMSVHQYALTYGTDEIRDLINKHLTSTLE